MPNEIERKFLVTNSGWKNNQKGEAKKIVQGYLALDDGQQLSIAIEKDQAFITLKKTDSVTSKSNEYAYSIPLEDAQEILSTFQHKENSLINTDKQEARVRIKGDKAFITLKRDTDSPEVRGEYEYPIPVKQAQKILDTFKTDIVEKLRHNVEGPDGKTWEVDVYEGKLKGLVIAELELKSATEEFQKPHWVGAEVTKDKRFKNKNLAKAEAIPEVPSIKY